MDNCTQLYHNRNRIIVRRNLMISFVLCRHYYVVMTVVEHVSTCSVLTLQICESDEKLNNLVSFLRRRRQEKHLVFFSTCGAVDYFSKLLQR